MTHSDSPNHDSIHDPGPGADTGPGEHLRQAMSAADGQLEQVRSIQLEQEAQNAALDERQRIIVENERTLAIERRGVLERGQELDGMRADIEGQRAALEEERRTVQSRLAEERASLERDLEALHELRGDESTGAGDADGNASDAERVRLEQAQQALQERATELESELAGRGRELTGQRRRADHLEEDLLAARTRVDELEGLIDSSGSASDGHVTEERDRALQELESARTQCEESEGVIAGLREQIEALRKQSDPKTAPTAEADVGTTMRVRAMQQRIYRLEEQLKEAESKAGDDAESATAELSEQQLASLREKASRLADVAQHLRLRQQRLRRIRRILRTRGRPMRSVQPCAEARQAAAHDDFEKRAQQMREIESARQDLITRGQELARTERKMIRRWARSKAIVLTGYLALLAVFAASVSWLAVERFVPATVAGTVTFEAKTRMRGKLADDEAQAWQTWHAGLVQDEKFRKTLAARMDERKLVTYASLPAINRTLDEHLTLDTTEPKKITVTLAGKRPREVLAFLDIFGTTVTTESTRQARKRSGSAWAVLDNERKEDGLVRYSTLNPTPVQDYRLYAAGPVFVVVFGIFIAIVGFICKRLLRVKREFDDDGTMFEAGAAR